VDGNSRKQKGVTASPIGERFFFVFFDERGVSMNGLSVIDLQDMMDQGAFSSRELCQETLDRIARLNIQGPELRAIIEENPDTLQIAARLDKEREVKGPRSLLHGIPIVLKDNIDTADAMQTTAGSLALLGKPAQKDAHIVKRLRDDGKSRSHYC
jgi:amidase